MFIHNISHRFCWKVWWHTNRHFKSIPYLFWGPGAACRCQRWKACWAPSLSGKSVLCGWSAPPRDTSRCDAPVCSDPSLSWAGPQNAPTAVFLREGKVYHKMSVCVCVTAAVDSVFGEGHEGSSWYERVELNAVLTISYHNLPSKHLRQYLPFPLPLHSQASASRAPGLESEVWPIPPYPWHHRRGCSGAYSSMDTSSWTSGDSLPPPVSSRPLYEWSAPPWWAGPLLENAPHLTFLWLITAHLAF